MNLISREAQTICAPITAPATAGVGVIRVSGERALEITRQLCDFIPEVPESHRVYYGFLKNPANKQTIDEVLVSYFAKGRSFTGEETLEISCHGSPAIISHVLTLLCEHGCLPAERGEFTFRAFFNGRIDLVQAESVLSLIHSQTELASRVAIRQLQGELSKEIQTIEDNITWTLANIEAGIDFSTEDIDVISYQQMDLRVDKVVKSVERLVASYHNTRPLVDGLKVVLAGKPNAGKSSLLNALLNQERAIVTNIPGTTRDLVEGVLKLEGGVVTIVDTAGLRETTELVEGLGIKAAKDSIITADIVCYLFDLQLGLDADDLKNIENIDPTILILVGTKSDKLNEVAAMQSLSSSVAELSRIPRKAMVSSASQNIGMSELKSLFNETLKASFVDDSAVLIQKRHFELLSLASQKSQQALKLLQERSSLEFVALELQEALSHIYELLGKRYDDQVMDRVFKEFCIGK